MVSAAMAEKSKSEAAGTGRAVDIHQISKVYGQTVAVNQVSLGIKPGEFVSLLGPSGSGKTTLLMMIAGFETPNQGKISIGERDVTTLPANKRNIGMVFQKYALFPHRTVAENLAFPLRMRRVGRAEVERKVSAALDMVRLSNLRDRLPSQLSGGQQQRVALARAVIYDAPVILMDEPLGALDKKLRQEMQLEIKQLQERLGATVIYVTHDQEEALTMSDRMAVMANGVIQQVGSPNELYNKPENAFIAGFLGEMNFIPAVVATSGAGTCTLKVGDHIVSASGEATAGERRSLAVRPELMTVQARAAGGLPGVVSHVIFNGSTTTILVTIQSGEVIRVDVPSASEASSLHAGSPVAINWANKDAFLFEPVSA